MWEFQNPDALVYGVDASSLLSIMSLHLTVSRGSSLFLFDLLVQVVVDSLLTMDSVAVIMLQSLISWLLTNAISTGHLLLWHV